MINFAETIRMLTANAQAMRALLESVSPEQAAWKPDPQTWSLTEVLDHIYNEERGDFQAHLREIFHTPPQAWGALQPGWQQIPSLEQGLADFLSERAQSLAWLGELEGADWDATITTSFGPNKETLTFSAGDILVSWVAHDHLHLRQLNELLFAWNAQQGAPYKVDYAGGW